MRKFSQILLFVLFGTAIFAQENFNLELVSNVGINEDANDIWGYVDSSGVEYAVMGTRTTTTIWSLEDPANPIERIVIPGPASTWRDIKHFEDHLYVTCDRGEAGLLIINMEGAPENITYTHWRPELNINGNVDSLNVCHNLYVDTTNGFGYLSGCNVSAGGVIIIDLNQDKDVPVYTGAADLEYAHDVYTVGDRMYASEIYIGEFKVYDISDKSNPVLLGGHPTSMIFTHNAWTSDDQKYLFTTDERENAYVDAFDISDLDNIKVLDKFQPVETAGTGVIPHNTHYDQGFLVTSWYTDGVVITDATKPDNLVKVAAYDTELNISSGFDGTWGAYPFLPSGLVLGSDINNGLFVFQPVDNNGNPGYQRATYLEGVVTDMNFGFVIPNVTVTIESDDPNQKTTGIMGEYKTGQVTPGTFDVTFSHPNYDPVVAQATLESGEVTILNVQLGNALISGTVIDKDSGEPISGASVVLENVALEVSREVKTDENGAWVIGSRAGESYNLHTASWGYRGTTQEIFFEDGASFDIELEIGYEDDFFADLGWEISGDAATGAWEIADAEEKVFGNLGIIQQGNDILTDIGEKYYVTDGAGGGAGNEDIDDGLTILTSPSMDMTGADAMEIKLHTYFANVSGNTDPNDELVIAVTNGMENDIVTLEVINETTLEWSEEKTYVITKEQLAMTENMQVIITAGDTGDGHVVEAGVDAFKASGIFGTGLGLELEDTGMSVYPNPADNYINLSSDITWNGENTIIITDINGKLVKKVALLNNQQKITIQELTSGMYSLQVIGSDKKSETINFIKK